MSTTRQKSNSSSSQILGYLFKSDLVINANVEETWKKVKNINNYEKFSNGALSAKTDEPVLPGKTIELKINNSLIPTCNEDVTVVDDKLHKLSWQRDLPLCSGHSERSHSLMALPENRTNSSISLYIPGATGFFTKLSMKKTIETAIENLHQGIKAEAESTSFKM